jgi:hypothetical protein
MTVDASRSCLGLEACGDPADSGRKGSPDRDRAPSPARKKRVGWFAGASLG